MASKTSERQHSNPFYISVHALCHNKRLKQKRSKLFEKFRNLANDSSKTDYKRRNKIPFNTIATTTTAAAAAAATTIDLVSDDESDNNADANGRVEMVYSTPSIQTNDLKFGNTTHNEQISIPVTQYAVPRDIAFDAIKTNDSRISISRKKWKVPHKYKTSEQELSRLTINESIVLSDDSNLEHDIKAEEDVITSKQSYDFAQQNSIQVDEVTVSLIPRSVSSNSANRKSVFLGPISQPFPMLPDETTVQTVIANRTYELPLTKLREGLASCGIPEFAQDPQQISMQRRKYGTNPPIVTPPQQPISLKLSSDLSISLISDDDADDDDDDDDDDESKLNTDPILNPALLQKLPLNISITPATVVLATPKRKLG